MVSLYKQPIRRKVISAIYHWYDMRVCKLPGFKLLEKLLRRLSKKDLMLYMPLVARQDERCYFLTEKERVVLVDFEVTLEQYEKLR